MVEDSKLGQNTTRASRRALKTRRRLLDAALLVFGDLGVESCTVENITERADLGKGTFYRHFEDKAALIRTLLEMAVDQLIERIPRPEKSRPLDDAVDQIIRAHIAFYMDFTTTYAFLLQNQLTARSRRGITLMHDEPLLRYIVAIESQLSAVRAMADNPRRLRMAACALAGWLAGFFAVGGLALKREELAASADELRQMTLHGIADALAHPPLREAARQSA